MLKLLSFLAATIILFSSCGKSNSSSGSSGNTFQAKINGQAKVFNVESATLIRSTTNDQKRIDIAGVSADGTLRLIITIAANSSTGNELAVKKYTIRVFNEDNSSTSFNESVDSNDGLFTFSSKVSSNWVTDIYAENGEVIVSACSASTALISGTFQTTAVSLNGGTNITVTEGKFDNIKYTVAN